MAWKLLGIEPSKRKGKKWTATFHNAMEDKHKTVHFGLAGAEDFTLHKDPERAERYRTRHAKDLETEAGKTGMSPGALSYWTLWSSPSFAQGIRNFKNHYHL